MWPMTGTLERVLVRAPLPEDGARWREFGWRAKPDHGRAAAEHEALRQLLAEAGVEVVVARHDAGNPDAIYVFDPVLVHLDRAVVLRPGKEQRRMEPAGLAVELARLGVRAVAELEAPAIAEGGDTLWVDERTLLVGRGYRTNERGIEALRAVLPGVAVIWVDLPHYGGAGEVMHLLSLISPLAGDLALVYPRLAPVRLLELLAEREIGIVEVPDEEFETMGPNVLALGPRRVLALAGNDETRRRLERAGVEVATYVGDEISHKGDGGPTCLTLPLRRSRE
jgi:dimethylargininase